MVELTEPHAEELVQRLQLVLYRSAVLNDCDVMFASDLVDRLLADGPNTFLDVPEWARVERILGSVGDPVEADALVEALS